MKQAVLPPEFFEATAESPGSWLLRAIELKAAADRLNWLTRPVSKEENALSLLHPYRLLIALSFENLLKGILIVQGHAVFVNGKFNKKLDQHDLAKLAAMIDANTLPMSAEELALLSELSPVIIWSGRYPLPKTSDSYRVLAHSNTEQEVERVLWERLCDYLVATSWVMKGGSVRTGGYRLYVSQKRRDQERA